MKNSKIEWCHHTLNFWWGCTKVSPACTHCYAATLDAMRGPLFDEGRVHWGVNAPRWVKTDSATKELRRLAKSALVRGVRERIFINSMSDTFEDQAQLPVAREILFAEIVKHPQFDFLLLTKRPENINAMVPAEWQLPNKWPAHVWVGTTVENQEYAEKRIPQLLSIPAHVHFLSCEPLLSEIDLTPWIGYYPLNEDELRDGGTSLCHCSGRGIRDRSDGANLALKKAPMGPLESNGDLPALRESSSGKQGKHGIPANPYDGGEDTGICGSASHCLPALQRTDPAGINDKPQGREQGKQSPEKPGNSHLQRTANSCCKGSEGRTRLQSERGEELNGQIDIGSGDIDTSEAFQRGKTCEYCGGFRDFVSGGIQNSERGKMANFWVIAGGESGPGARPMNFEWASGIRNQCKAAGIPFFMKQMGGTKDKRGKWEDLPEDLRIREFPETNKLQ